MIRTLLDLAGHPFGVTAIAALSRQHGIRFGLKVGAEDVGPGFPPHMVKVAVRSGVGRCWCPALGACRCSHGAPWERPTARSLDTHPPLGCNDLKDLGQL